MKKEMLFLNFYQKKLKCKTGGIKSTVFKILLYSLFLFSANIAYAQSNEDREILLERRRDISIEDNQNRDIDILSLLPTVFYDVENENLIIESSYVTFENVPYYMADATDSVLQSGVLYLQKDVERTIPISSLCSGIYIIAIEIDGVIYSGEFEIE